MLKKTEKSLISRSTNEKKFFADVIKILQEGRSKAHTAINLVMVETYWNIGRRIVEQEQQGKERANYGDYLIVNLSRYLTDTFGKGFSEANIRNMRQFYIVFPQFARQCLANLSWTHITLIMRIDKSETMVKYSVLKESRQILASKYMLVLPTEEELEAELERNARYLLKEGGNR